MSNSKNNNRKGHGGNSSRMTVQDHQTRQQLLAKLPSPDEEFEPIQIIQRSDEERAQDERITLFYIGDIGYSIPARPRVNLAIKYLKDIRDEGEELAQANLLVKLIGDEGYDALCEAEDILPEQFEAIMNIAAAKTLGALENSGKN